MKSDQGFEDWFVALVADEGLVAHGGLEGFVSEDFLELADGSPVFKEMNSEGMAQHHRGDGAIKASLFGDVSEEGLYGTGGKASYGVSAGEQEVVGGALGFTETEEGKGGLGEFDRPDFSGIPGGELKVSGVGVDLAPTEGLKLPGFEATSVEKGKDELVAEGGGVGEEALKVIAGEDLGKGAFAAGSALMEEGVEAAEFVEEGAEDGELLTQRREGSRRSQRGTIRVCG